MAVEITLRSLAKQAGISYQALCQDVKNKYLQTRWDGYHHMVNVDDPIVKLILEQPEEYKKIRLERHKKFHRLRYKGKEYPTVTALAKELKLSRETVYRMLERGVVESLKNTS